MRVKYGVDEDTCTGDHSCIRLSGCPTLTVKDNPDPLRRDPVATVIDGCVGCGLCGENAHAAVLCPSFYRAEVDPEPERMGPLQGEAERPVHMNLPERPITILIAALGGEGGGVMADWLMEAATASRPSRAGHLDSRAWRSAPAPPPTTSRSFRRRSELGGSEPVLSLTPSPGNVDVMVASELVEAGRAMPNGYVSPERTTLIASTHRIYATVEKMQMADGRFDSERVVEAGQAARASARCSSTCASSRRRAAR